jgi:two-component system, chemotaxis family, CheB/CheR fusion protein
MVGKRSSRVVSAKAVVALCGTAAETKALERFLATFTQPDDAAVVIVLQHREALDEERLRRVLENTGRELSPVADDAPIEQGRLYLPTSDVIVTVEKGRFQTRPAEQRPGERGTIDSFLVSFGREEDARAVAVLFTVSGGDGVLGMAAIKAAGGLAVVEETEQQHAGDLAASNSPAALADFILPAEELANRVALHLRRISSESSDGNAETPEIAAALTSIATILRNRTGHDFHGYKRGTFLRRVHRRMQVVQADAIERYVETLQSEPDEVQLLFNDLLIGVTQFFRDAKEFDLLERETIPKLFEGKGRSDQLRVWVIGCSTGEEAYSLAILLREHMAKLDEVPQVQIFATDLDGRALASARSGRYADTTSKDVPPERLARWFMKEGNTYCVVKELREMCIFSQHSIIKDAPFSRLDLVSCRNLLIYLDAELQGRVIPLFHFALKSGGFLFLGNSENVSRHTKLFAPVESRSRIFRRVDTATRTVPDFPFTAASVRSVELSDPPAPRPRLGESALATRAQRIAERYTPAYVITDAEYHVLHFSGRTGRFLEPAGGAANLNLLNLVHPELRLDLRAALGRAVEQDATVQVGGLSIGQNGKRLALDLVVEPVPGAPGSPKGFVVLFKDGTSLPRATSEPDEPQSSQDHVARIQQLEAELRTANDHLQATVEELETTNEELKSSNEEYQSLNEELQSANEELETSKEELQSVNEELTTVNGELAHRVQELGRANSDLKNLLESTQIATLFLDNNLRVMNFTPAAAELFHVVEHDIGRPLSHIKSRIDYDALSDDARRVLRTLGAVDREVNDPSTGASYMVRVLPYRTTDNYIGGVVITFTDLSPLARAQQALRESEAQARLLLAELQHRVRNTLAVVRSIARRSATNSESVEDYAMHLEGRISAFARVQAAVTRDPTGGIDLEMLVADELNAHKAQEGEQVTSIKGPKLRLQPKAAETLGLVVHELTTNAVKYGALSAEKGLVAVNWAIEAVDGHPRLVFHWVESGVGLDGKKPTRRGFGTELIERTLAYDLNGKASLGFAADGLRCTLSLPADEKIIMRGPPQ